MNPPFGRICFALSEHLKQIQMKKRPRKMGLKKWITGVITFIDPTSGVMGPKYPTEPCFSWPSQRGAPSKLPTRKKGFFCRPCIIRPAISGGGSGLMGGSWEGQQRCFGFGAEEYDAHQRFLALLRAFDHIATGGSKEAHPQGKKPEIGKGR